MCSPLAPDCPRPLARPRPHLLECQRRARRRTVLCFSTAASRSPGSIRCTWRTTALQSTAAESSANNLVRLIDDGSPTPTAILLATAPTNTAYRGVSLAPLDIIFRD